jgi:hypothetical protein
LVVIAVAVALGALAVFAGGAPRKPGTQSSSAAQAPFSVTVSRTPVTQPIAANYLGLAIEYKTIVDWVGAPSAAVDPPLVQLIRNLNPVGRPLVRVGGQSTDRSWWPVTGLAQPLGVTYTITPAWTTAARALAKSLNGQLMLGLNLEANRTRIPQQEAEQFIRRIGTKYLQSFQIGNEPELYRSTPWYRLLSGRRVPWYSKVGARDYSRALGYEPADYASEIGRIEPLLPKFPLAGPETGNVLWMPEFLPFVSPHSEVRTLTIHAYGTNACDKNPSFPTYPTIPHLLSQTASRSLLSGFTSFLDVAHRDGADFRVDEMGSVTCNGTPGVSDTMASALWVMDALFSLARSGVDGVNLHSYPGSDNGLFDFTQIHGRWQATVHPLYYGALMFAQAAPAGSRLLQVATGSQDQVRAWATIDARHVVRVLLINDGLSGQVNSVVHAPAGYGSAPASLERLSAPGASAKRGIKLGGRQFGTTSTGVLPAPLVGTVSAHAGAYSVNLPASSAALLVLSPPKGG